MANVGEVLPCGGAQQLQEGHLHRGDGVFSNIDVVQLGRTEGEEDEMNEMARGMKDRKKGGK